MHVILADSPENLQTCATANSQFVTRLWTRRTVLARCNNDEDVVCGWDIDPEAVTRKRNQQATSEKMKDYSLNCAQTRPTWRCMRDLMKRWLRRFEQTWWELTSPWGPYFLNIIVYWLNDEQTTHGLPIYKIYKKQKTTLNTVRDTLRWNWLLSKPANIMSCLSDTGVL